MQVWGAWESRPPWKVLDWIHISRAPVSPPYSWISEWVFTSAFWTWLQTDFQLLPVARGRDHLAFEVREMGDNVTNGSDAHVLTSGKMCAVIAARFCCCFAIGMVSAQLLFWKLHLNSRCPEGDYAEDPRQVDGGCLISPITVLRIWLTFVVPVIKAICICCGKYRWEKKTKKNP